MSNVIPLRCDYKFGPKLKAVGIDPGLSGAISIVQTDERGFPRVSDIIDLAEFREKQGTNYYDIGSLLPCYYDAAEYAQMVVVEDVQVQSAVSSNTNMFKLGYSKGVLATLAHHNLSPDGWMHDVWFLKPAVWKGYFGLGKDKTKSLSLVRSIMPCSHEYFTLNAHHDRAEATLLALAGLLMQ